MQLDDQQSSSLNHNSDLSVIPKNIKNFMREDSQPFNHPNSASIYFIDSKDNASQLLAEYPHQRENDNFETSYRISPQLQTQSIQNNFYTSSLTFFTQKINQPVQKIQLQQSFKKEEENQSIQNLIVKIQPQQPVQNNEQPSIKLDLQQLEERNTLNYYQTTYQRLYSAYELLELYIFERSNLPLFKLTLNFDCQINQKDNENKQNVFFLQSQKKSAFNIKKQQFIESGEHIQFVYLYGINILDCISKSSQIKQHTLKLLIQIRNNLDVIQNQINFLLKEFKKKYNAPFFKCRVCGDIFENGRQIGGHMSRKHPGRSKLYRIKKQVRRSKATDRKRKIFFKKQIHIKHQKDQ